MKIAIYVSCTNKENLDLSSLEQGNPGIGGTQYQMFSLPYFFSLYRDQYYKYSFKLYWHGARSIRFKETIDTTYVSSDQEAVELAFQEDCDLLVFNGSEIQIVDLINKEAQKTSKTIRAIAWVHVFLPRSYKDILYESPCIYKVVCLSKEHYQQISDHPIIKKLTFIYYGFDVNGYYPSPIYEISPQSDPMNFRVCFLGGLIPAKGFHLLASIWKDILKEIPLAELYVIGSGRIYDNTQKLGIWGIADEEYERLIRKYLSDDKGDKLISVKFLGLLGQEKKDIMKECAVGIVNPSGATETFCLSALEFQSLAVPVLSRNFGGLKETIKHQETGLLSYNTRQLKRQLLYLLQSPSQRVSLGLNGKERVQEIFAYSKILSEWEKIFTDVSNYSVEDENLFLKILLNKMKVKIKRIYYKLCELVSY